MTLPAGLFSLPQLRVLEPKPEQTLGGLRPWFLRRAYDAALIPLLLISLLLGPFLVEPLLLGPFLGLGVVLLGATPNSAQADLGGGVLCPSGFPLLPPSTPALQRRALQELDGLDETCRDRAAYFAWKGTLLLLLHHPQDAANALEKALLLAPELAGAQLDYAQALAQLGETSAARGLALTVLVRSDIPQNLHDWLAGQVIDWQASDWHDEGLWQTRWTVQSMLGRENNLNAAPSSALVTLTLPGGNVPVVLAQNQRPESALAMLSTAAVEAVHRVGQGQLTIDVDFTQRSSPDHPDSNLQWADVASLWSQAFGDTVAGVRWGATRLWMGGQSLYQENAAKLFVDRPWNQPFATWPGLLGECRYGSGFEYSIRNYPAESLLNGVYDGLELGLGCQRGGSVVALTGQWGVDHGQNPQRLGGDQARDDYSLSATTPWGRGSFIIIGQWSRLRDQDPYSSLLGGVDRLIIRREGRLEYDWPLSRSWTVLGYFDSTRQASDVSLFTLSDQAIYLGLRWVGK